MSLRPWSCLLTLLIDSISKHILEDAQAAVERELAAHQLGVERTGRLH